MSSRQLGRFAVRAVSAAVVVLCGPAALAQDAQIVMVQGRVEVRDAASGIWRPAVTNQKVNAGEFVRTGDASQMALLVKDQTQVRLNQQSLFQIKSAGNAEGGTQLELTTGRMWAQAKQFFTGVLRGTTGLVSNQRKLTVTTPTSTIGIRGTDWEVNVGDSGTTTVAVFSGEVAVGNDLGEVAVGPSEQATVQTGKAPVKVLLTNARDRVQWVTAYRPAPRRWLGAVAADLESEVRAIEAGDYAAALKSLPPKAAKSPQAAMLLADLFLFSGRADEAINLLSPIAQNGKGNATATALQARALIVAGRLDDAQNLLTAAGGTNAGQSDILLARADLARLKGEGELALSLFRQVLQTDPKNHEAWFGVARIEGEKDNLTPARGALEAALGLAPNASGYRGELATLLTQAGDLTAARSSFDAALQQQPDDYLALTGLGILQLKSGQAEQALQSFLKAGVIEPRFARAQLYTAVAYYQLGNTQRALETVRKAAELDSKDPLPHVLLGLIQGDALDVGAAVQAAREAQLRMPYLKSLNPIANNQKGSANLGSALAGLGAEEWASYYAAQAYTPFWAGSHLFLADRYTGKFNKNSELFTGFLTDPTVFGASNRNSSLVRTPGHYGRIDLQAERHEWSQSSLTGAVNGLVVNPVPVAYFLSGAWNNSHARLDESAAHGNDVTLGLGVRPNYNTALFAFATRTSNQAKLNNPPSLPDSPLEQTDGRTDMGGSFRIAADNQIWFKAGSGRQRNSVTGPFFSPSTASQLNSALRTNIIKPTGTLDSLNANVDQDDVQVRHAFVSGGVNWSWGLEHSHQKQDGPVSMTFSPVRFKINELVTTNVNDAYGSARYRWPDGSAIQVDMALQRSRVERADVTTLDLLVGDKSRFVLGDELRKQDTSELNPRVGYEWQVGPSQSMRFVAQSWRRPASAATLAAIDTLGVAVNDRLTAPGGRYQRARIQYDGESGNALFLHAFVDREQIDNGLAGEHTTVSDFQITQLESLRNRSEAFSPKADLEETPIFVKGAVSTLGVAASMLVSRDHMVSARFLFRDGAQEGASSGAPIPFVSKHYLLLSSQWSLPERWLLGASAAYRSTRDQNGASSSGSGGIDQLAAGWAFGLTGYWETADKRSAVQIVLDNLLSSRKAGLHPEPHFLVRYTGRF